MASRETINAKGLVVAPGFIDTHFHSLDGLSTKMAARDGVTTGMDLEIGAKYGEQMYDPTQDKFLTKDEYLKIAKEDPGRIVVLFNPPRKKWLSYWLRMPHMTVASDAIYSGLS